MSEEPISKELKSHVIKLLDKGARLDGRELTNYREPVTVEYGTAKNANGSATVTIGETVVMAGVKMSLDKPYPDSPEDGNLMVGVELLPLSNPEFESGPPKIQAIELGRVVDRGIRESHAIDTKSLCIEAGEKVWGVIIDICPINDAGNLFDAAALAAVAAIKDVKLPKIENDAINYKEATDEGLKLAKTPVSVTVCKIGKNLIVDPISEEEKYIDSRLTVATDETGALCALQKGGDEPLTAEEIDTMVGLGIEKCNELRGKL